MMRKSPPQPSRMPRRNAPPRPAVPPPRKGGAAGRRDKRAQPPSPLRWVVPGGIVLVVLIAGVLFLSQQGGDAGNLPSNFSNLDPLVTFIPADAEFYVIAQTEVFESLVAQGRQVAPGLAAVVESALGQILINIRDLGNLLENSDWIGGQVAFSLFPQSEVTTASGFLLVVDITDRARAETALTGLMSGNTESVNGFTRYHLTDSVEALLNDHFLLLTDATSHLPTFTNIAPVYTNSQIATLLNALTFSQYDLLMVADTTGRFWKVLNLPQGQPDQPYVGVAVARPESDMFLIDMSQADQAGLLRASGDSLLSLIPSSSVMVAQFSDLSALYERLLASEWINQQFPGITGTISQINTLISTATGIDYQHDFLEWMTGDVILFADAPATTEPAHALNWGLIVQAADAGAAQRGFDLALAALPARVGILHQVIADIPFDIRTENLTVSGGNIASLTLDLVGNDDTADVLMALLNDGAQMIIGNRYGVQNVLVPKEATVMTSHVGRYAPYTLDTSTLSAVINIDTLITLLKSGTDNTQMLFAEQLSPYFDLPIESIYIGIVANPTEIASARLVFHPLNR